MKLSEAIEKEIDILCQDEQERKQVIEILDKAGCSPIEVYSDQMLIGLMNNNTYTSFYVATTDSACVTPASDFISSNATP